MNAIAPGMFPTDLNAKLITGTPRGEELHMRVPMGRFGKARNLRAQRFSWRRRLLRM